MSPSDSSVADSVLDVREAPKERGRPLGADLRQPRRPREFTPTDLATVAGSVVSSLCLNWLVFHRLTDGVGWFGFLVCAYVGFLVLFAVATADRLGRLIATDRVITVVVVTGGVAMLVPLMALIGYIVWLGIQALRPSFFFDDQGGITPVMDATAGGGLHAIIGSIQQVGLALIWSMPLALAAAVFLNESRSRWRRPVRIFVDAMSGLPSIVAGLFIYATLILPFAGSEGIFGYQVFGFNGLMASFALAITMLPTITRTVDVVLRLVPNGLREASLALGASRARTVWSVVFPTARSGMTTAIVLGIARAVGETAPLLFTAFGFDIINGNPLNGSQESLPLFVYKNVRKPDINAIQRGFAGALVLLGLVLILFAIARFAGRDRSKGRVSRRTSRATPPPDLEEQIL